MRVNKMRSNSSVYLPLADSEMSCFDRVRRAKSKFVQPLRAATPYTREASDAVRLTRRFIPDGSARLCFMGTAIGQQFAPHRGI
jgi:hypothetical protein